MNLLSSVFKTRGLIKNNVPQKLVKNLKILSVESDHKADVHDQKKAFLCRNEHFMNQFRNFTKNNGIKNSNAETIFISKTHRKVERRKIRDAIQNHQQRLKRNVGEVFEERQVFLTNTRKKIQEKGKLLIHDIKERKEKMKEKFEDAIERENIYTIPNFLCVTRMALSPLLGFLIVSHCFEYALGFMIISGISDWFDGWIARNYKNQSSKIGSFLDPMADKILIGTLVLSLTYVDLIPVALTGLIIARDIILIISGFVIRYMSLPPPRTLSHYFDASHATAQLAPTYISKVNTGIQLTLLGTTLAAPVFGYVDHDFLHIMWYVTATSTILSAISYIFSKETYRFLRSKKRSRYKKYN